MAGSMARELLIAFGIMAVCLVVHVTGMILLAEELVRQRLKIGARLGFVYAGIMLIAAFFVVITLHAGEAVIWAGFYDWAGLFKDFETSLYFSMQSYSTVGYGDVLLPEKWRLLGTIEGISGVLLCGLSAAFLFAIVNALFRSRLQRWEREDDQTTNSE
jgi:voltage-gated potassium channel